MEKNIDCNLRHLNNPYLYLRWGIVDCKWDKLGKETIIFDDIKRFWNSEYRAYSFKGFLGIMVEVDPTIGNSKKELVIY